MRRLLFVDVLRGIAIFCVIVFHAMTFNIFGGTQQALDAVSPVVKAIAYPIGIIGSWAAIFIFLSGIANTAAMYNQLKKGIKTGKLLLGAILPGLAIITINYVFMILFSHYRVVGDQEYYSIINGFLETLSYHKFDPRILLFNSALIMIGFGTIISNTFLIIFRRNLLDEKSNKIYWILMVIGLVIFAFTPLLDWIFQIHSRPPSEFADHITKIDTFWEAEKYLTAYLTSLLVGPRHSIFPYAAYGLFGSVIGIMILRKVNPKKFMAFGYIIGGIFTIMGFFLWIPLGVPSLNEPKYSPNLYILDLGLLFCLITFFTSLFEFRDDKTRVKLAQKTIFVRRYSMSTLTIFIFESTISTGIAQLFNVIFSGFYPAGIITNEMFGFIVYLPLVFFLWHFILKGWEKVNFIGSVEWITNEIVGRLRGRKSDKLNANKILYNPITLEDDSIILKKI
ncbi:MAG: hypothetical protein JW776_15030 [Candidatus Lokiarchaeota archaeon]|nr:hypothetical protein [Candidatus Lokiarchaeota archaeon]